MINGKKIIFKIWKQRNSVTRRPSKIQELREIKDIVVEKIDSISIENTKGIQSNLAWASLGFIVSLISWYFLDESVLSTSIAIISMIAGLIFLEVIFYYQLTAILLKPLD